jgi:cell division septation protein DedD
MKMVTNKALLALSLALLLAVSACSRQQSDWEKTRAANTTDAYELFLKKYPSGEFTAQAQARVKELYEERDWQKARDADTQEAYQAFLKQYPEGKWAEEARIRVENFTLAQAPSNATPAAGDSANTQGNTASGATAAAAAGAATAVAPTKPSVPPASSQSAAKPPAPTGSYGVQLGAFKSGADAAHRRWAHLNKEYPKILAGLSPTVSPLKSSTGTLYRLQATGLTEKHASSVCKSLKSKSQGCILLHPTHH